MALYTYHHDAPTITAAGREWVQRCLVRDGSILGEGAISTAANYDVLDRHFLQRLDVGSGNFFEKLRTQLEDAPPPARKLMAELLWALLGSTPKSRTVVKGLRASDPAWRVFAASSGCGIARCIRTHQPWRHRVSDTSCGRPARA